jgi:hypothetical protein
MKEFNLVHAEALYLRFCAIYGDKFIKQYHSSEFKKIWYEEWFTGLVKIDVGMIKDCLEYCKTNLEWPPSIAEFRKICETLGGMPSFDEAFKNALRNEFVHPVVRIAYDNVGSWAMKNDKQDALLAKFKSCYVEAINLFRENPNKSWELLELANQNMKSLPAPSKIPSKKEITEWNKRMKGFEDQSKLDKLKIGQKSHPTWQIEKIQKCSRSFDKNLFDERKNYLLNLDEALSITLNSMDWYDRVRYLREIESSIFVNNVCYKNELANKKEYTNTYYYKK